MKVRRRSRVPSALCCLTWCPPASISRTGSRPTQMRQKLSPLVDRINDRYGHCAIGFGLFPPDVRAFKGYAAFHRVPKSREF